MSDAAAPGGLLGRFRRGLARTREILGTPVGQLLSSAPAGEVPLRQLEVALVRADVGPDLAAEIVAGLDAARRRSAGSLPAVLREELVRVLAAPDAPAAAEGGPPHVVFFVGVNGTGKTTTIGKLAARHVAAGRRPLLAACDTFRAAAIDQLVAWSERSRVPVVKQGPGADPAAVLHDALTHARERGLSPVLVDTAGRLHVKTHLMQEMAKLQRVAARLVPGAPHEALLVLDATTGQNGLAQAREFAKVVPLTGLVLTKLDGTAKGGIAFAICREMGLPIRWVGLGEGIDDLLPFDAGAFVDGLLELPGAAA